MIDIKLIRTEPDKVAAAMAKRGADVDIDAIAKLDAEHRSKLAEVESLRAQRNEVSKKIGMMRRDGADTTELQDQMQEVSNREKALEHDLRELTAKVKELTEVLPNITDDDVAAGGKEANEVVSTWGTPPELPASPKDHVELASDLDLVDYKRGANLSGGGYWIYKGKGAQLEWGLINWFIQKHLADGYEFVLPPHILGEECGFVAGQFPKFREDVFQLGGADEESGHFLIPTSETAIVNLHRDESLRDEDLPKKYFAYTPCYRREAGGYRTSERGTLRGHQFNKVEMFIYSAPSESDQAFEELVRRSQMLVEELGLHYQCSKLAAGDVSASMARTYDIEVLIPSVGYKEVSSISNARDYQARRGSIRYKGKGGGGKLVHTLNASGLATSRLFAAILEQFQQDDGSVVVPEVLRPWVGVDVLS